MTLIQFATDEVLANLLPLMALRPARVIHVGGGIEQQRVLLQALSQEPDFKGWQPKVSELQLPKVHEINEVRDAVATTLVQTPGAVLNLAGASQLVGIGAYQAALALGRATLFFDAAGERFVDGRTGRLGKWPDYREAAKRLSTRLLMAACGKHLSDWRAETANDALRAFALKAFELHTRQWSALDNFSRALRSHLYGPTNKLPTTPEELGALLAKPLPPQMLQHESVRALMNAAAAANLVRAEGQGFKLIAAATKPAVERVGQLLMQRWIEPAVLDRVLHNPRYRDAHWSLSPVSQANGEAGEPDILCIDTQTSSLRLISCKATIERSPMELIDAVSARAAKLGATSTTLVVFKPAQGQEQALRAVAKRKGIDLAIEPDEIVKWFALSVK